MSFDARDSVFHADPYPMYAHMRKESPVLWYEDMGFWLLTRYEDVSKAVKNPRLFSHESFDDEPVSNHDATDPRQAFVIDNFSQMMMYKDGEAHARIRRQGNRTFSPREVAARRAGIENICRTLLEESRAQGTFDYAQQFAMVVPSMVTAEYLGVAPDDREEIRELADRFSMVFEPLLTDADRTQLLIDCVPLADYFSRAIKDRRANPRDDFISLLVNIDGEHGGMSDAELLGNLLHLIVAGNETTTNLLGHLIVQLSRFPQWRDAIADHTDLAHGFLEETLRYEAPIQILSRKTTTDIEMHGVTVPEGALVALVVGSANRDGDKFPDPDTFDPTRTDKSHLSFGQGSHFCLGAPLARLEAAVVLQLLCNDFRDFSVDTSSAPTWKPDQLLRGYTHLRVKAAAGV